jgi:hypothetical protein
MLIPEKGHPVNWRRIHQAVYPYKLKVDASPKGSQQHRTLEHVGINYLYRYAALITFANWLIELRQNKEISRFPDWLVEHREISRRARASHWENAQLTSLA